MRTWRRSAARVAPRPGVLRRIMWDPNFCAVGTQGFEHTSRRGAEECRLAAGSGPEAELDSPLNRKFGLLVVQFPRCRLGKQEMNRGAKLGDQRAIRLFSDI